MSNERPSRRLRAPSPALVVASLALAIALSGVTYAAVAIPRGSVGTAQLKRNAVTSPKVKDRSLKAVDLAAGVVPAGPTVFITPSTAPSVPVTGIAGVTDTTVRTLSVPAGRYHVLAKALVINGSAVAGADARCFLRGPTALSGGLNGVHMPLQAATGFSTYRSILALDGTILLTSPGALRVDCNKADAGQSFSAITVITATRIAGVTLSAD